MIKNAKFRLVAVIEVVSNGLSGRRAKKALVLHNEAVGFLVGSFSFDVDELVYIRCNHVRYRLISNEKPYKNISKFELFTNKREVLDWLFDWEDGHTMCDGGYTTYHVRSDRRRLKNLV